MPKSSWFLLRAGEVLSPEQGSWPTVEDARTSLRIAIPLRPITSPRIVATAMGNVVRTFFADGSSGKVIPASQELEASVDQWISKGGVEAQLVEVWALISPKTDLPRNESLIVGEAIIAGSHLHKVLSGGGGWGNRQGLLALDPELDFDDAPEFSASDLTENADPETEKRTKLGQIVNPGDTVQFFMRHPKASSTSASTSNGKSYSHDFPKSTSVVFGTIPSTLDAMPVTSTAVVDDSEELSCTYVQGHFGMLSEQGISLSTTIADGRDLRTKIDVPHTAVSLATASTKRP
ncbi:MAG: hypothetical protein Q9219_000780 [cf. Caloplaca sp. 3 TL-2023]